MILKLFGLGFGLCLSLAAGTATSIAAQETVDSRPELAGLARLVGGRWYLGADSYHTFEWGVGGQSLKARSYFVSDGAEKLVSELTFMYHPGEDTVKGYGVAIDMGIDFFEYDVETLGDQLIFSLTAFGAAVPPGALRETWTFTDDDHYEWALLGEAPDGSWSPQMGGTYERRW